MKNSSGFDNSFSELNRIPRPQKQKQESFRKIINEIERKPAMNRYMFPRFLTAAAALAACVLFAFIIYSEVDMTHGSNSESMAGIGNSIITQTAISLSESEKTFSAERTDSAKSAIVQDEKWENTVRNAVDSAQPADAVLSSKPLFDVQIMLKGKEPIKLKIWEEDGEVFIRPMASEKMYKVSSEESGLFLQYLKAISDSLQKTP
ncbi:hypothetical protein J7I93_19785 [Bacillus sp. ISL-47]|uniref:hypothetical protein n=1 Tax=Bacillus sp. ISL-47 TaxID=2819130 RepID=UPI001BE6B770|nr:hypothetical protein [Bacillus sp. ISL-47]MBT2690398.1 hypothetical protein [Bacillus sp. ISL-47]MBT2707481.1 hypothetical protein [Pseudomonas sp. ISL-84]